MYIGLPPVTTLMHSGTKRIGSCKRGWQTAPGGSVFAMNRIFCRASIWSGIASAAILLFCQPNLACAQPDPVPPPAISSFQHLNGKTVRTITVIVREIFDDPHESALYKMANKVKMTTREEVVKRELLIHEGEPFDDFRLRESERNLRNLGFLREVQIIPVMNGDTVDLTVSVQDTWTFIPQFSYSSGTGRNKRSAGLAESDLLGTGKRVELAYQEEDKRRSVQGVYEDDRVWGTLNRLLAAHLERSDGHRTVLFYGRPFRSLVEKQSWSVSTDNSNTVGRLFEHGNESFVFRQKHVDLRARYTLAHGDPKVSVGRYSIGYGYLEDQFKDASINDYQDINVDPASVSHDPALLAKSRRFTGPLFGYAQIQPDYISMNYVDRFDRVEDYNLGNELSIDSMLAFDALGSLGNNLLVNANDSIGYRFSRSAFLRGEIGGATRYDGGELTNSLVRTDIRFYNVLGLLSVKNLNLGRHTLAAGLSIDYGEKLDRDRQFLLGADIGLRGYEARTFSGDKRLILNLEDRMHFIDDAFHLVSIGAAVFFDAGGSTEQPFGNLFGNRLYSDVGAGLRIAFPRSTGSRILRLDVAFPMRDGPEGTNSWEPRFIISGGQIFGSHLPSETEGPERANVSVGFER